MEKPSRPHPGPLWVIPPRAGPDYPPPTPQADWLLWECALSLWDGVERAMAADSTGRPSTEAGARLPARQVRRAVSEAAAAYQASGISRSDALVTARRAALIRMVVIARRARAGMPLCPELECASSGGGSRCGQAGQEPHGGAGTDPDLEDVDEHARTPDPQAR